MPKQFCATCLIELRVQRNGIVAVAMTTQGPMEARHADLHKCPVCGWKGAIGFATSASANTPEQVVVYVKDVFARNASLPAGAASRVDVVPYWLNEREKNEFMKRFDDVTFPVDEDTENFVMTILGIN